MLRTLLLIQLFFVAPQLAQAQISGVDYDWKVKRNKDNIQIATSKVTGSPYKAVRGEMTIKGSVAELVALVDDLPNCDRWADLCKYSEVVKKLSATERYVYIYNRVPFPIKDRDVVARIRWSKSSESGKVTMHSVATEGELSANLKPLNRRAVRIKQAVSQWHFTPLDGGFVKVENFAHINPNGPTPAWLTNMLLVNSPFKTMRSMRAIIEAGDYAGAELMF